MSTLLVVFVRICIVPIVLVGWWKLGARVRNVFGFENPRVIPMMFAALGLLAIVFSVWEAKGIEVGRSGADNNRAFSAFLLICSPWFCLSIVELLAAFLRWPKPKKK